MFLGIVAWWFAVAVLAAGNVLPFLAFCHHERNPRKCLNTFGWLALLLGHVIPLGMFAAAYGEGSPDSEDSLFLIMLFCWFAVRIALELGKLSVERSEEK